MRSLLGVGVWIRVVSVPRENVEVISLADHIACDPIWYIKDSLHHGSVAQTKVEASPVVP